MGKVGTSLILAGIHSRSHSRIKYSYLAHSKIVPCSLKVSAESSIVTGAILLKLASQLSWAEVAQDHIGHDSTAKCDKLSNVQEIICPLVYYPGIINLVNGCVLQTYKGSVFKSEAALNRILISYMISISARSHHLTEVVRGCFALRCRNSMNFVFHGVK